MMNKPITMYVGGRGSGKTTTLINHWKHTGGCFIAPTHTAGRNIKRGIIPMPTVYIIDEVNHLFKGGFDYVYADDIEMYSERVLGLLIYRALHGQYKLVTTMTPKLIEHTKRNEFPLWYRQTMDANTELIRLPPNQAATNKYNGWRVKTADYATQILGNFVFEPTNE